MGIFIEPCEIKEKVSEVVDNEKFVKLYQQYEKENQKLIALKNINAFEDGIYIYKSHNTNISVSYTTNYDFIDSLRNISEFGFSTTLSVHTIDGYIPYTLATDMLDEFVTNNTIASEYYDNGTEYDSFLWNIYQNYMKVLTATINIKGIIYYH